MNVKKSHHKFILTYFKPLIVPHIGYTIYLKCQNAIKKLGKKSEV